MKPVNVLRRAITIGIQFKATNLTCERRNAYKFLRVNIQRTQLKLLHI